MSGQPKLLLDWCSAKAAKYACENWHYTRQMPCFKTSKIGVWENGLFRGCLIYTSPFPTIRKRFKCSKTEMTELARVALRGHDAPVSKMIRISLKMIKKANPGLKVCVSYADTSQGHHGGIYQGSGFKYFGEGTTSWEYWYNGKWTHCRSVCMARDRGVIKDYRTLPKRRTGAKHCYALELDKKSSVLLHLDQQPYPKRVSSDTSDTPASHAGKAGATPSDALQEGLS